MTPSDFSPAFAKPPPATCQERQYLLSQTAFACAQALNCFTVLRSALMAIQAKRSGSEPSHLQLLARLSLEVLDDCAARLQTLYIETDEALKTAPPAPAHSEAAAASCLKPDAAR